MVEASTIEAIIPRVAFASGKAAVRFDDPPMKENSHDTPAKPHKPPLRLNNQDNGSKHQE